MKRIIIIKNGVEITRKEDTEEVVNQWLADGLAQNWFGRPAQYEEIFDAETNEFKSIEIQPAESFEVVGPVDITDEVNQRKINFEARLYLAETDYKVLRHIREKALGLTTTLSEAEYLELEQSRMDAALSVVE